MAINNVITNARYIRMTDEALGIINQIVGIECVFDGVNTTAPIAVGNREYDEIMQQVEAGHITIADDDSEGDEE